MPISRPHGREGLGEHWTRYNGTALYIGHMDTMNH